MAFDTKEQEIIKYGVANGKSRQEVEQAIANYRAGIVKKKEPVAPTQDILQEPSLGEKLAQRAKDFRGNILDVATLGASSLTPQDIQEGRQSPKQGELVALQALNTAFGAPAKALLDVGGAISDVAGTVMDKTGANDVIAKGVEMAKPYIAPIVKPISPTAQKIADVFHSLPPETQDYIKRSPDFLNVIGLEAIPGAIAKQVEKQTAKSAFNGSALDFIKNSQGGLTQKAVDFISNDPSAKVETILKRSTVEELDNYLNIAQKSSVSGEAKTVLESVGDKMAQATKEIEQKLNTIGAEKSSVMAKNANINFTSPTKTLVKKLEEFRGTFTNIDAGDAAIVDNILADAKAVKTTGQADVFIDKAQDAIYKAGVNLTIPKGSALEKKLQKFIGEYNSELKKVVPEQYAVLNKQYSELIDTLGVLNKGLGEVVGGTPIRGAGLVKQYFSPAGSRTKELFEFIKKETDGRFDLAKDATLAKFAGQLYGDSNVESLLGGIKDIPTTAGAVIGRVAERIGGKQVEDAMRQSVVRKAKKIISPEVAPQTYSPNTEELKSIVFPSANGSTQAVKGKGIKGMINPKEMLPKKNQLGDTSGRFTKKEYDLSIDNAINSSFTPEDLQSFLTLKRQFSNKKLSTVNFEIVREDLANLLQKYGLFKYEGKLTPADNEIIDYISKKALQASEKAKIRTSENMNQFLKNR